MEIIDKLELIFNYILTLDLDSYIFCVIIGMFINDVWHRYSNIKDAN